MRRTVRIGLAGVVLGLTSMPVLVAVHAEPAWTLQGAFKRTDIVDSNGNMAPAIGGDALFTLDTGPRAIAVSEPTLPEHTRHVITLFGADLAGLVGDSLTLRDGNETFEVPTRVLSNDDLEFRLDVPAGAEATALAFDVGAPDPSSSVDNPRRLQTTNMLSIVPHDPPLQAFITTGVAKGGGPHVRTFTGDGPVSGGFMAGDPAGAAGVHVARGDVDGDGIDEIVTGAGPGQPSVVAIYTPAGGLMRQFEAYPGFTGGVNVTLGDLMEDAGLEIVTAPEAGGGPHVRTFSEFGSSDHGGFMAYDAAFRGGVRVAAGDIDGDGLHEIITAPGPGGGPHVRAFRADGSPLGGGFMAYAPNFTGGIFLATVDFDGDAIDEIVTGPGAGGGPHVRVFEAPGTAILGFMAYDPSFTGGVSVARVGDDITGPNLIAVGAGPGGGPHVKIVFADGEEVDGFYAYDPNFHGGVYVAGGIA